MRLQLNICVYYQNIIHINYLLYATVTIVIALPIAREFGFEISIELIGKQIQHDVGMDGLNKVVFFAATVNVCNRSIGMLEYFIVVIRTVIFATLTELKVIV